MSKLKVPGDGYALVVDKSDQIVAHPDSKLQSTKASELNEHFSGKLLESFVARNNLQAMSLDNRDRLIYAKYIPHSHWSLILVMDKETLFSPVRSFFICN